MTMDINFTDKRVFVTGVDQPIGAAAARAFIEHGATVAVHGAAIDGATELAGTLDSAKASKAVVNDGVSALGGLDILVNAADYRNDKPFDQVTPDDWEQAIDGVFSASLFCTQFALPALQASKGNIVNVTSVFAQMGGPDGSSAYTAAAGSIVNMTRMQALRFGVDGVRSNCLCAGPLEGSEAARKSDASPLGRHGSAQEMAATILFLASSYASFMTGAIIVNDGGRYSGA
jgi:meso-butanediol dehydrogenase / (S,S)-butanediol dehydrogenase / diacetyl reductase